MTAVLVALIAGPPAEAFTRPAITSEITVSPDGSPGSGAPDSCSSAISCSAEVAVTPDGHFAAFSTVFNNLVPGDNNGVPDVFVRDLWSGQTERVSVGVGGAESNDESGGPSISDDGRYVAFESEATNLTLQDSLGVEVFVFDRVTSQTELVGLSPRGELPNASGAVSPQISGDGTAVAFWSSGFSDDITNVPQLPGGGLNFGNVYVRDLVRDKTEMVSLTHENKQSLSATTYRSALDISRDGRFVAFDSRRHDLVAGDDNASVDVFVVDRENGEIERVSVATDGTEGNWASYSPSISADGRFVTFFSFSSNLVPTDTNQSGKTANVGGDVFVHDRLTGETERVSVSSSSVEGNFGGEDQPTISPDGRFVSFLSISSNLIDGTTNDNDIKLYLHDRLTGQTELASIGADGGTISPYFAAPSALSLRARNVLFSGGNLTTPFEWAIYERDRGDLINVLPSVEDVEGGTRVSGSVGVAGVTFTDAVDASDDSELPAARGGLDIAGASLDLRPESGDLRLEIDVPGLVGLRTDFEGGAYAGPFFPTGVPGTLHAATFESEGVRYEVRITRTDALTAEVDPVFRLYRCTPNCVSLADLSGGYGTSGEEIVVAVPLDKIGDPTTIGSMTIETGIGDQSGIVEMADQVILPARDLPRLSVEVGRDPQGGADPIYGAELEVIDGRFSTTIPALAPGDLLWIKVCYDESCLVQPLP